MITRNMIVREVIAKYPETINVFGRFRVDFCCGGAHSIEDTARACRVYNIEELMQALNETVTAKSDAA